MSGFQHFRALENGGFVRDLLLGVPSKDRDITMVLQHVPEQCTVEFAFALMKQDIESAGYKIFVASPEHATIRAHAPIKGDLPADFVLARTEGPYSDGRRPDWVALGTIEDDIFRRDLTINAMLRDIETGEIIDLVGGQKDLAEGLLRFVGDPFQRITEDALRVMRVVRFAVTRGFTPTESTLEAINDVGTPALLAEISEERREMELRQMFEHEDTLEIIDFLKHFCSPALLEAMFSGRVRLTSTLKKQRKTLSKWTPS